MFAQALKSDIETHVQQTQASNALLHRALDGTLSPVAVGRYLVSLRYMIGNTPRCLAQAAAGSRANQQLRLAAFFDQKKIEEQGHEAWALADLDALRKHYNIELDSEPVPAIRELLADLEATIERAPVLYLAYVFWAEYFVVLAGRPLADAIINRCGYPPEILTCLVNHITLDEEHAANDLDALDQLIDDPRLLTQLQDTLRRVTRYFDRGCSQMVGDVSHKVAVSA